MKAGETPGYPRFKSSRRWHTIELANVTPSMVKPRGSYCAIRIKGLPEIRLRKGLNLPEDVPKALTITLRGRRLFVNLTYEVELATLPESEAAVGVDMGVSDRLALSNGEPRGPQAQAQCKVATGATTVVDVQEGQPSLAQTPCGACESATPGAYQEPQRVPSDHDRSGAPASG